MDWKQDTLYMVPLGGCGEYGGNLTLYGWNSQWLMLDCGIGFDRNPAMAAISRQVLMPDPSFIAAQRDNLLGCIITHAHEDHIGAVPYLWDLLKCPVYLSPFAARIMASRALELGKDIPVNLIEAGDELELGPFTCLMIGVTHSIPEAMMVAIKTPAGTVVHTGDWKLDDDPLLGDLTDEDTLQDLGDDGVLAVIGDSTNAGIEGESGAEVIVRDGLSDLFATLRGRIVVAMMSRHLGRIQSIIEAAHENGREVAMVGRSLWNMDTIGRDLGYFADLPPMLNPKQIMRLPPDRVVLIATGTQGESNAALARIAENEHPVIRLQKGDTVVFSARVIPGNEAAIADVQNRFISRGIPVITREYPDIYVSGHPCNDELRTLYDWLQPEYVIPVHGEPLQQHKHAEIAAEMGAKTVIPVNGSVVQLSASETHIVGAVTVGRLALHQLASEDGLTYRLDRHG